VASGAADTVVPDGQAPGVAIPESEEPAAAIAADANDVEALHGLGKALVYTGQGARAKEVLLRAKSLQPGFVDPWRNNALAVQQKLDESYERVENDRFVVSFHRDDQGVLQEYLMPLCLEASETLGKKYGHVPEGKVAVEVFHTWDDFSVRTVGFRGFTALGACFGKFLTLVSPGDSDLRRQDFMWQATMWHEYAHVLTLGVSKHRVPRWLTEGFSVHEEKQRDPTWERGMDRELFDAFYSDSAGSAFMLSVCESRGCARSRLLPSRVCACVRGGRRGYLSTLTATCVCARVSHRRPFHLRQVAHEF
jgi:hypothetical protein